MIVRWTRRILALAFVLVLGAGSALAHKERPITSPPRPGDVPDLARECGRTLVVCKASSKPTKAQLDAIKAEIHSSSGAALELAKQKLALWKSNSKLFRKCRYEHIQAAVNDATDGTCIKVLPGVYREEPSRAAPTSGSGDLPNGAYSYEYHVAHPNDANLIAILGLHDITLEGTGVGPRDVVVDAGFVKDVPIRGDRADGIIVRNLWARDGNEHCIYIVETSGFVFDRTVGSFCRDYELFSFASDHGLWTDCEAEGGGDSGIYAGGQPDTSALGRFSGEIRNCKMHTNSLGFSGTQGNSIWMHDNDIYDNAVGISFDTENDHPDPPQRQSVIENNLIHDNNLDIYSATTPTPAGGPAYGFLRYPVGSGMWLVGGQDNVVRNNFIWNNQRFGVMVFGNPLEAPVLAEVHRNQVYGNIIGTAPDGTPAPNGTVDPAGATPFVEGSTDLFWGGSGNDNCWGPQDPRSGVVKYGPVGISAFQPCPFPNTGNGFAFPRLEVAELLLSCVLEPDPMNPGRFITADDFYPCPWGQQNFSPYQNIDEQECGNGTVDLGEQCDAGYGGGAAYETCDELGHGPGTLVCNDKCDFDTSGCAADTCGRFANATARLVRLNAPAGQHRVTVKLTRVEVAGATFDPVAEGLDLTIRNGGGVLYQGTIPPGSLDWNTPGAGVWVFKDLSLSNEGLATVQVRSTGAIAAKVRGASISGAAGSETVSITVRIGDDCWSGEETCTTSSSGATLKCKKTARP